MGTSYFRSIHKTHAFIYMYQKVNGKHDTCITNENAKSDTYIQINDKIRLTFVNRGTVSILFLGIKGNCVDFVFRNKRKAAVIYVQ